MSAARSSLSSATKLELSRLSEAMTFSEVCRRISSSKHFARSLARSPFACDTSDNAVALASRASSFLAAEVRAFRGAGSGAASGRGMNKVLGQSDESAEDEVREPFPSFSKMKKVLPQTEESSKGWRS